MGNDIPPIEGTPKAALESYVRELETFYYPWYDRATTRNYYAWFAAQAISLVAGFLTAILAALIRQEQFSSWSTARIALVVLPLVGSLASTFLVQSRIAELEAMREKGRETIQHLAASARVEFAAASTPEQFTKIHQDLVSKVSVLEQEQSRNWQRLIPSSLTFHARDDKTSTTG